MTHHKFFLNKKTVWLFLLLTGGLILRLGLSVLNRSGDVNNHIVWTQNLLKYGAIGFYERDFSKVIEPNYPPLTIFFFLVSQWLYQGSQTLIWWLNLTVSFFPSNLVYIARERFVLEAFYKLPAIFADIGIAWLLFLFATRKKVSSNKTAFLLVAFVVFNPAFFYNSAYWGQVESLPIFFMVAAFYFLLCLDRKVSAILLVCLALLSKQTMVVFLPLWFFIWLRNYSSREKIESLVAGIVTFILMFIPFHTNALDVVYLFTTYIYKILLASGSTYATNHAFNIWYMATKGLNVEDTLPFVLGLPYRIWGFAMAAIAVCSVAYILMKKKLSQEIMLYAATLLPYATFLLLPRVHERHFEPVLAFLLLLYFFTGKYLRFFIFLSLFHFINLYHGWWQPEMSQLKYLFSMPFVIYGVIGITVIIYGILMKDFIEYKKNHL